ncbi:MAG: hypothetical protein EP307_14235 [Rhodobacteraceae bacterium]|nr:MAG: hypothetical protein EP307_14235 [Paracoccaceae bacterium]
MTRNKGILALTTALCMAGAPVLAQSQGDWTFGLGVGWVNPKSNNGVLAGGAATVDENTQLIITAEYFFRDNLGVEILAATPFEHDVTIAGIGYAGTVKHLPPTISLNYHFPTQTAFKPYVGLGVNWTTFFEETSPLGVLSLDDSFGLAVQVGFDYQISDRDALRLTARWIDIETDVSLNGAPIGTADIDPVVLSFSYVRRF